MTTTTPNFGFTLVDFNKKFWHQLIRDNWSVADAVFANYITISNLQGVWQNSLVVTAGQKFVDADLGTIWEVLVDHTTASSGTFLTDRTTNTSYWLSFTVQVTSKGAYTQNTVYSPNDFVLDGFRYGVVQSSFTADSTQATTALSYDLDVTNGNIITLVDVEGAYQPLAAVLTATTASFLSADRTKLDTIETSATADQTGAEIKTAYELEANAFTDTQFTKLAGIATAATADAAASQAEMETGTSTSVFVSPGRQENHPAHAKGLCFFEPVAGTIGGSYNVTSLTDTGVGLWTVNWDTDFSSTNYHVEATAHDAAAKIITSNGRAVGGTTLNGFDDAGVAADCTVVNCTVWGDQ
jgi:hypothetical protein